VYWDFWGLPVFGHTLWMVQFFRLRFSCSSVFLVFYEGKMSGTFMDERFRENIACAKLKAYKITFGVMLIALIILCQGKLFGNLEYTLIASIITLSLALALGIFLSEYLLYRYDHDDQAEESEE
jgi:magnesium-transporting ATPase (P-type)